VSLLHKKSPGVEVGVNATSRRPTDVSGGVCFGKISVLRLGKDSIG
jgi:hypothetical protein